MFFEGQVENGIVAILFVLMIFILIPIPLYLIYYCTSSFLRVHLAAGVCWAAFQVFDKDCSGTVTFDELEQVLNSAMMEGHDIYGRSRKTMTCRKTRPQTPKFATS